MFLFRYSSGHALLKPSAKTSFQRFGFFSAPRSTSCQLRLLHVARLVLQHPHNEAATSPTHGPNPGSGPRAPCDGFHTGVGYAACFLRGRPSSSTCEGDDLCFPRLRSYSLSAARASTLCYGVNKNVGRQDITTKRQHQSKPLSRQGVGWRSAGPF